jgi:hypothetical protein
MSASVIIGMTRFVGSVASTGMSSSRMPMGRHCCAPAGDFVSSHS